MSKQPHVIVTVGTAGNIMAKPTPDKYSVEAYGYDMEDVVRLITAVHDLVRPVEDDDEELPIPFKIPGFTLMSKLSEANAEAWQMMRDWKSNPDDPNAAAHSVADGLDRCDCGTNTPSPGRIAVRLNGVNHRFPSYGHARDFVELYGLKHTAIFIRDASDPSLCCFPYVFQLPTGEHMAFETRGMAEELARINGIDLSEITYHEDEHRPGHRVDEEQWRARTKVAKAAAAAPEQSLCTDESCQFHGGKHAHGRDELGATVQFGENVTVEYDPKDGDPFKTVWQPATDDSGDIIGFREGGGVKIPNPTQTAENTAAFLVEQHPNPCLPGCGCGNGPTPLAADDPTDG